MEKIYMEKEINDKGNNKYFRTSGSLSSLRLTY